MTVRTRRNRSFASLQSTDEMDAYCGTNSRTRVSRECSVTLTIHMRLPRQLRTVAMWLHFSDLRDCTATTSKGDCYGRKTSEPSTKAHSMCRTINGEPPLPPFCGTERCTCRLTCIRT